MTGIRPLLTIEWPATPGNTAKRPAGSPAVRSSAADDLVTQITQTLAGGPALAIIPAEPPARRRLVLDVLDPEQPLERPDVAFVVTTSGTSGVPKGVLLTAAAVTHSARATHDALGGPGQWLLALPPAQIAGLQVVIRSVLAGRAPEGMAPGVGFTAAGFAAAADRLDRSARRYTALVPTQLDRLLADPAGRAALASFDTVLLGGAAAPARLWDSAAALGIRLVGTYGMTETAGGCVYDGRPLPGVRVEIGSDQRIRLAGPMLASGYRLRPELTAQRFADGWFLTSDRGEIGPDGRLRVLGRTDDVITTGGIKVSAAGVARLLEAHPRVAAAAVFGIPDEHWGERVVAAVVPVDPAHPPQLDELRDWVRAGAEPAQAPRELLIRSDLPMLASGKVDIAAIKAGYQAAATPGQRGSADG
ncbi:MAG: o-succinylbenzoate--CoA ligase [Sporichthyaceae bacterium]|nr:o-succinylbenzoate--CoA ligase [Sporichthyaceae bacterium]